MGGDRVELFLGVVTELGAFGKYCRRVARASGGSQK
jgi:hypothetical protein